MRKEYLNFKDSTVFEGMTSIRAILRAHDAKINDRKIKQILFDKSNVKKIGKELGYLRAVSDKYEFELLESSKEEIEEIALGNTHGGLIAICESRSIPSLCPEILKENSFYVMIQGIEDPYNFGYAIRSLYAAGVEGVILDERNWMSAAGVVARSSAGASEELPMYTSDASLAVDIFKSKGYDVVCADLNTELVLGECEMKYPIFLIVGGERRGISRDILQKVDKKVKIEYAREFRASLSAASATTMFAYEIMRQNKKHGF